MSRHPSHSRAQRMSRLTAGFAAAALAGLGLGVPAASAATTSGSALTTRTTTTTSAGATVHTTVIAPEAVDSYLSGLNDLGTAVGTIDDGGPLTLDYRYDAKGLHTFSGGPHEVTPVSINDLGQVIGTGFDNGYSLYLLKGTTWTLITAGQFAGLNNVGQLLVQHDGSYGEDFPASYTLVDLLHGDRTTKISAPGFTSHPAALYGSLNELGQVAFSGGSWDDGDYYHAWRWSKGSYTELKPLPGGQISTVAGISNRGDVFGQSDVAGEFAAQEGAYWPAGSATPVAVKPAADPANYESNPQSMNAARQIAGEDQSRVGSGGRAALWTGANGAELATVGTGVSSSTAPRINELGQVGGSEMTYTSTTFDYEALAWWKGRTVDLGEGSVMIENQAGEFGGNVTKGPFQIPVFGPPPSGSPHATLWTVDWN